jgi:hypothetical protein
MHGPHDCAHVSADTRALLPTLEKLQDRRVFCTSLTHLTSGQSLTATGKVCRMIIRAQRCGSQAVESGCQPDRGPRACGLRAR